MCSKKVDFFSVLRLAKVYMTLCSDFQKSFKLCVHEQLTKTDHNRMSPFDVLGCETVGCPDGVRAGEFCKRLRNYLETAPLGVTPMSYSFIALLLGEISALQNHIVNITAYHWCLWGCESGFSEKCYLYPQPKISKETSPNALTRFSRKS